ncbi:MAG: FKBP-type peptidyl-prolyl cis-trans isomerase [Wenzhouxiangella sp.]|nr:FKBP-type peptidyl-prolyl cis-trans isomerase [Wenzhouxiangella sp.]MCH8479008.1 FKBP-type peptidyl-prolyl cis-trans isomerase [Wenzhouxiangella sp.]
MQIKQVIGTGLVAAAFSVSALANDLQSMEDRVSYMIGMDIGQSLGEQDMDLNIEVLIDALRASFKGEELLMTDEEALAVRNEFMQARQAEMEQQRDRDARRNLEEGQAFLAQNRERADIVETESGLQYRVIEAGDGRSPGPSDVVTVHYRGTLLNGTQFDSSFDRGEPATFALNQVIPGWTEGVQLMQEGARFEFFIPAELAYGEMGRPGPIGPNSTLIFEVELIEVQGD